MKNQAIAVVGLACRFPGADHHQDFWHNQLTRRTSFRTPPAERWDHSRYLVEGRSRDSLTTNCAHAAFLDDPWSFAGPSFNIAPLRAESMDPQQRLALELAQEALQSAGLERRPWERSQAATFLGVSTTDYSHYLNAAMRARQFEAGRFGQPVPSLAAAVERVPNVNSYSLPGCLLSMCASNVAQALDMGGPAFSIDAACASSLMAIVQAVQYLRSLPEDEPSPLALAGGVYMLLSPDSLISFSRIGAVAPRECRPFDKDSAGFLMGEGGGVVALKRLADAERDGDPIYAVIRGVAWNSDGKGSHPMMPTPRGQTALLDRGLREAGLRLSDFGYLECHGTATRIGDKVELEALAERLRAEGGGRPYIGSVKANIGHTMSAAGVAGFLRAVLSLHHRTIPAQANWTEWNPDLLEASEHFQVPLEARPWGDLPLRATVNSFGFGGTNAFVALEAWNGARTTRPQLSGPTPFWVHADSPEQLPEAIRRLRAGLAQEQPLDALAYTLSLRSRRPWSAALLAADAAGLQARLDQLEASLGTPPEEFGPTADGLWWGPSKADDYPAEFEQSEPAPILDLPPRLWLRKSYLPLKPAPSAPEPGTPWERQLSLVSHPALADHRVSGRPLLPFALALDMLAESAGLEAPLALADVSIERSLVIPEAGTRLIGRDLELFEIRPTGRESRLARASLSKPGAPPLARSWGEALAAPEPERFYAEQTFHGPAFQGIEEFLQIDGQSASARLRGSQPRDWSPDDPRSAWTVDPLVLDSGLQLGLLWSMRTLGKWMLPRGARQFVLLEPFGSEGVEARIQLGQVAGDRVEGDLFFYQRGRLVGWLAGLFAGISQAAPAPGEVKA